MNLIVHLLPCNTKKWCVIKLVNSCHPQILSAIQGSPCRVLCCVLPIKIKKGCCVNRHIGKQFRKLPQKLSADSHAYHHHQNTHKCRCCLHPYFFLVNHTTQKIYKHCHTNIHSIYCRSRTGKHQTGKLQNAVDI